jgi:glycosyltransferase involved in cell wall biosynthesis
MSAPALSLVVPVYNEELVLERSLRELCSFAESLRMPFEIVCVDDGSHDRSAAILGAHAQRDPRVRVERHAHNRGKGAAVRTGMLAARGARVVFLDADLSTPLEQTPALLAALETHDVALGNRRMDGAAVRRRQPWVRQTLGRGFTLLARVLLASRVSDYTCGFKAFRRDAAQRIFARSTLDGWAFDAELVAIAHAQRLSIAEVPVQWHHEDDSKVRVLHAIASSLRDLVVIAARRASGRYR